jgi:signal transduction histidine kinase
MSVRVIINQVTQLFLRFSWPARDLLSLRLEATEADELGAERALSLARALLAVAALFATVLDPTKPARYATAVTLLLGSFAFYSVALTILLRRQDRIRPGVSLAVHVIDVVIAGVLTLFTEGVSSPFYIFFLFVLLTAAYRWGLRATLATALVALLMLGVEALATSWGGLSFVIDGPFELNRFVIRSTWLLLLAVIVGYLAEQERLRRVQSGIVGRFLSRTQSERSLFATLVVGADELFRVIGGRSVRLVAYDINAARLFEWNAESRASEDRLPAVKLSEISADERPAYFFETPTDAWLLYRRAGDVKASSGDLSYLHDGVVQRMLFTLPVGPLAAMDFRTLATVTVKVGVDWHFRMFITDPAPANPSVLLSTLDLLGARVAPAVYNAFQAGRHRSRAGAIERARVARELHDGIVQSLIGTEMRLDAVRRRAVDCGDRTAGELAAIQQMLRGEIVGVRELMQQLGNVDTHPIELVERLANVVDRFERETGIAAQFASAIDEVDLSPRACGELVRITQEALANVRRHSGARHAVVHMAAENGHFTLTVDDDGCGLPFEGRREHQELDLDLRGPRVIKERVRSIGGELAIESRPGLGVRLEVMVPRGQVRHHA